MHALFCEDALDDMLIWRAPEILYMEQGSQFTSHAFAHWVLGPGMSFLLDDRGRFLDNNFIEPL